MLCYVCYDRGEMCCFYQFVNISPENGFDDIGKQISKYLVCDSKKPETRKNLLTMQQMVKLGKDTGEVWETEARPEKIEFLTNLG